MWLIKKGKLVLPVVFIIGIVLLVFVMFDRMVNYVDAKGVEQEAFVTILEGGQSVVLEEGTYLVNSNITFEGTLTLCGDVTIILADGCVMTVKSPYDGIKAFDRQWNAYNLTIYGQTKQNGMLDVEASGRGIWAHNIIIHGGIVKSNTTDWQAISATDSLLIDGGRVLAYNQSLTNSAMQGDRNVSVLGGKVSATSGCFGISTYEGDINLGYSRNDDYINTSGYYVYFGEIKIRDGKTLTDGVLQYTSNTESDCLALLKNATLTPNIE